MAIARLLEPSDIDGFVRDLPLIRPESHDDPVFWKRQLLAPETNPIGPRRFVVVEEGGQYLSMASTTPKPLAVGGENIAVAEIGSTFTRPEAQGKGHFSALIDLLIDTAVDDGVAALYGTPNPTSAPIYINKLRWAPIFRATRWVRPLRGSLGKPVSIGARAAAMTRFGSFTVSTYPSFAELPNEVEDVAWARRAHLDRTAEYMAWRAAGSYRFYALERGERVVAWAAVNVSTRAGTPIISLADIVLGRDARGAAAWFLDRIVHLERDRGEAPVRFAYATTQPRPKGLSLAFLRAGFAPIPSPEPVIFQHAARTDLLGTFEEMSWRGMDADTA